MTSLSIMQQLTNIPIARYGFIFVTLLTCLAIVVTLTRTRNSMSTGINKEVMSLWIITVGLIATTIYLTLYHYGMNTKEVTISLVIIVILIITYLVLSYIKSNKNQI